MKEIKLWNEAFLEFLGYGLKESSAVTYTKGSRELCKFAEVENPYELLELGINKIEKLTQSFIRRNQTTLAPKYINIVYCSIKRWCMIKELIKSAKAFKEIKFDKSSRKTEALTETPLETEHIKRGFKVSKLDKKSIGVYMVYVESDPQ